MTVIERPAVSAAATTVVRLLIGLQMFFWVGYLMVMALLLVAAAKHGGFDLAPFHVVHGGYSTMRDPKEVLGLGIAGHLLHIPLAIVVLAGTWPGAFVGLAGGVALATARRIDRSLRWKLIGSTALTLAFVAVQFSPFGELVRVWMLD